jgi:hypothetical protein
VLDTYATVFDAKYEVFDAHLDVFDANTEAFEVHGMATLDVQYVSSNRLEPKTIASSAV